MSLADLRGSVSRLAGASMMLGVLLLICAFFTWQTWGEQTPGPQAAAVQVLRRIAKDHAPGTRVVIAVSGDEDGRIFATALSHGLHEAGMVIAAEVQGTPPQLRQALVRAAADPAGPPAVIACSRSIAELPIMRRIAELIPALAGVAVEVPSSVRGSSFLSLSNLLNVANQIVVIAVVAIGMTMVIITGGIDLSVGSLIALASVVCTLLIQDHCGGEAARGSSLVLAALAGIAACALIGAVTAAMIVVFAVPPFIVTLAMMLVGSGLAYLLSHGQSVYRLPESFMWLGRGTIAGHVQVSLLVMLLLYGAGHVLMRQSVLGRYIYAVGGNREAARLAGVPVGAVLFVVYILTAALAGLGGIITASQLKSGSPTYGVMYELYVIAAVVVGGTSLAGGEGSIIGTLLGAFIIAVIQNGMNLIGIESYPQKVVLGLVILGAVLIDRLRHLRWWRASRT